MWIFWSFICFFVCLVWILGWKEAIVLTPPGISKVTAEVFKTCVPVSSFLHSFPVYTAGPCRSGEGPPLRDFQSPTSMRNSDHKENAGMLSRFSRVRLFVTLWSEYRPPGSSVHGIMPTILTSIQECWGGLPCPPPGDLSSPCLFCLLRGRRVVSPLAPPGKPTVPGNLEVFPGCPSAAWLPINTLSLQQDIQRPDPHQNPAGPPSSLHPGVWTL